MHLHSRLDRSVGYLLFMRRSVCHRRAKPIYWTVSRRVLLGNWKQTATLSGLDCYATAVASISTSISGKARRVTPNSVLAGLQPASAKRVTSGSSPPKMPQRTRPRPWCNSLGALRPTIRSQHFSGQSLYCLTFGQPGRAYLQGATHFLLHRPMLVPHRGACVAYH